MKSVMNTQSRSYYLDKLGLPKWIYQTDKKQSKRVLFLHDEKVLSLSHEDDRCVTLFQAICHSVGLEDSAFTLLECVSPYTRIEAYLSRYQHVIMFGQAVYDTLCGLGLVKSSNACKVYLIQHKLSDGLSIDEKKQLYCHLDELKRSMSQ
jgi:hypothetical protein